MERTFNFYADPGHAWLQVKRDELKQLDIEQSISRYSYQQNDDVFLEEDCDAGLFIEALKKQGHTIKFIENHTNHQSRIRGFDSFRPSVSAGG